MANLVANRSFAENVRNYIVQEVSAKFVVFAMVWRSAENGKIDVRAESARNVINAIRPEIVVVVMYVVGSMRCQIVTCFQKFKQYLSP